MGVSVALSRSAAIETSRAVCRPAKNRLCAAIRVPNSATPSILPVWRIVVRVPRRDPGPGELDAAEQRAGDRRDEQPESAAQ